MTDSSRYSIRVEVEPAYLDQESAPQEDRYVFSYTVTIQNLGEMAAKLVRRHWIITDANGERREVSGEGVVGEQPLLGPGDQFRYTSGAMLNTPVGSMEGSYELIADDGTTFTAAIPAFTLAMPRTLH
ncbi:ApaG protein [Natronocella acetinitrilica]|uniref:Protein ApaG n=1 Tax=Natronocella acetinitrilica TaxID=414046 RepID=A0AAE3G0C4_9GAMM|nr:Co2+/Mg2+ efflux protein ApaG [Natronocella acetinitrilica]MCP1672984.1 ApaG protein [Natronocella acetinitrilica]